ncbi:hypothetical protein [Pantoea sp. ACRSB]|uniref:hypothetical protein n=1 Tax=Pantoea sp. ACRSB TaxID=2918207 RepID=UPI0028933D09|nr:hypothetical protein [Pantoea sp. ACRSB]MCG7387316.1 hypothetical protein [Pantoea sp. ACRSB]
MNDNEVQMKFESLRSEFLNNPVYEDIILQVEKDIFSGIKTSPEHAVIAHYEYQALQRILGKISTLKFSVAEQRNILSKPRDVSDY